jgi:hypothetical protein
MFPSPVYVELAVRFAPSWREVGTLDTEGWSIAIPVVKEFLACCKPTAAKQAHSDLTASRNLGDSDIDPLGHSTVTPQKINDLLRSPWSVELAFSKRLVRKDHLTIAKDLVVRLVRFHEVGYSSS